MAGARNFRSPPGILVGTTTLAMRRASWGEYMADKPVALPSTISRGWGSPEQRRFKACAMAGQVVRMAVGFGCSPPAGPVRPTAHWSSLTASHGGCESSDAMLGSRQASDVRGFSSATWPPKRRWS